MDMIKIIDYFNHINEPIYNNLPEDVYFTVGCYRLKLKTGDDDETMRFAVHCIYYDKCFGVHHVWDSEVHNKLLSRIPYLLDVNPYVCGNILCREKLSKPIYININLLNKDNDIRNNTLQFTQCIKLGLP